MNKSRAIPTLMAVSLFGLLAGCEKAVSFDAEVTPILDRYCTSCHQPGGDGHSASGLSTASYADLMAGTKFGPVVVAGDTLNSNLIVLVEGRADPSIAMPHAGDKLTDAEIATLKTWIDQGAKEN